MQPILTWSISLDPAALYASGSNARIKTCLIIGLISPRICVAIMELNHFGRTVWLFLADQGIF